MVLIDISSVYGNIMYEEYHNMAVSKGSPTVAKFRTLLLKSFEILASEMKKIGNGYQ